MQLKTKMKESLSYLFSQIQNRVRDKGLSSDKAVLGEFTGHCSSAHLSPLAFSRKSYIRVAAVLYCILPVSPSMIKLLTFQCLSYPMFIRKFEGKTRVF